MRKILNSTLDIIFPRRCPVCDDAVDVHGALICRGCAGDFNRIRDPYCLKCGRPLFDETQRLCDECKTRKHDFVRGRAVFEYDEALKESIYRYKYGGRREYADYYGRIMADTLGDWIRSLKPDALIPVPVHKKRLRERGYNQAQLLSRKLSELLDIPTYSDILTRTEDTRVQKGLNARERQNNLKKALKINCDVVKLKNIIVIDDIYTTGSTIDAAASCFKDIGVTEVYFAVLGMASKA